MGGALIAFGNDELHRCGNCSQCGKKRGDAGEKQRIHKTHPFCRKCSTERQRGARAHETKEDKEMGKKNEAAWMLANLNGAVEQCGLHGLLFDRYAPGKGDPAHSAGC